MALLKVFGPRKLYPAAFWASRSESYHSARPPFTAIGQHGSTAFPDWKYHGHPSLVFSTQQPVIKEFFSISYHDHPLKGIMVSAVRMVSALAGTMIYAMKNSRLDLPNNDNQCAEQADRHLYLHIGSIVFLPAGACKCQTQYHSNRPAISLNFTNIINHLTETLTPTQILN